MSQLWGVCTSILSATVPLDTSPGRFSDRHLAHAIASLVGRRRSAAALGSRSECQCDRCDHAATEGERHFDGRR